MEYEGNKVIISRVRKNGAPIGFVAAVGEHRIGWSRCSKKDKWNIEKGKMIAIRRATYGFRTEVHNEIKKGFQIMHNRAIRYFGEKIETMDKK